MAVMNVGVSGLMAAQVGLQTASHNISNASTPGYNRQEIVQTTLIPMFSGAGFIGQGTNIETVKRVYSDQLTTQVMSADASASEMDSYLFQVQQVDNLFGDATSGLAPALSEFFQGVGQVSANPSSMAARQSMLSKAQSLVSRFNAIDQRLQEMRDGINSQVITEVGTINSYAAQLADINQRIMLAQVAGPGQTPNDLLDQRQRMLSELNKEVKVTTTTQSDGTVNIFIGNGQPLVVGTQISKLKAAPSPDDPQRMVVFFQVAGGAATQPIPESAIGGGKLGGLIAFRRQTLDGAQNGLGSIAITLAQNFNEQHQLGMDLNGDLGGKFFATPSSPAVYANKNNADNTQLVTATVTDFGALTSSDYRLTFNGGTYSLARLSDGQVWTAGDLSSFTWPIDGITVDFGTWSPSAGDSFLIQPARNGAKNMAMAFGDPAKISAAAPMRTARAATNIGDGSISAGSVDAPPPPNADLQNTVTITFNTPPTTFDVVDTTTGTTLQSGVAYTEGADIAANGWTVQINGSPAAGDVFTVSRNDNGVADNRNAVLLGRLQTKSSMINSSASYGSAYAQMISIIGNKAHEVEVTGKAQATLAEQTQAAIDQSSGVNLDEEAANLLRYQQAYQASAKVIGIASTLFDTVLSMMRN